MTLTATPSKRPPTPAPPPLAPGRRLLLPAVAACVLLFLGFLCFNWPFTQKAASSALQHELGNSLRIGAFQTTFFPLGYVAENISFPRSASGARDPQLTIRKLVVVTSPLDLLLMRKRVERVLITGLRFTLPAQSTTRRKPSAPRFSEIGRVQFEDAILEFPSFPSDPDPLTLFIKEGTFKDIGLSSSGSFSGDFSNNKLPGAVHISGQIGPWDWKEIGRTQIEGSFALPHADLATFGGIQGILNASGHFKGPLNHVSCKGSTDIPEFQVSRSSHAVNLSTTFNATVNGVNGDVVLENAQSHFNRTIIESQGLVQGDAQRPGKIASLQLTVEQGQIGDVLLLFTRAPQPSMAGVVDLRMNVEVPPGPPGFLKKVTVAGDFGIDRGRFTKLKAQQPINHLSESAAGMGREAREQSHQTVLSNIAGHVSLRSGLATLSQISFEMPGAHGVLSGTYNLLNQAVNLDGHLITTGELSSTTSGFKAVMLKVVTPFFTKHAVKTVPFSVTGTPEHPTVALNLLNKHGS